MGKLGSFPGPQKEVVSRVVQVEPEFRPPSSSWSFTRVFPGLPPALQGFCSARKSPGGWGRACTPKLHGRHGAALSSRATVPTQGPQGSARSSPAPARHSTAVVLYPHFSHPVPGTVACRNRLPAPSASSFETSSDIFH